MRRDVDANAMTCGVPMVLVRVSIKSAMSAADLHDFGGTARHLLVLVDCSPKSSHSSSNLSDAQPQHTIYQRQSRSTFYITNIDELWC